MYLQGHLSSSLEKVISGYGLRYAASYTFSYTIVAGLAIIIAFYYPTIAVFSYLKQSTSLIVPQMEKITGPNPLRHEEPNFGYGNVKVSKLLIHPIKSCRGTSVESCRYTPEGLENDRKWCIIEAESHHVITAREVSKMVLIVPRIELDENSPHGGVLHVSFPEDSECEDFAVPLRPTGELLQTWELLKNVMLFSRVLDGHICEALPSPSSGRSASSILSAYFGRPVHLVMKGSSPRPCDPTSLFPKLKATAVYQDGYPLLLLSEESMREVERELRDHVGTQGIEDRWRRDNVVIERFRPNIVLRGAGPFAEDDWEEVTISSDSAGSQNATSFLVVSKCTRCLLPNVDTETGIRDNAVPYKVLMKFRIGLDPKNKWKPCVGCNSVPLGSGVIKVGDSIHVKKVIVPQ